MQSVFQNTRYRACTPGKRTFEGPTRGRARATIDTTAEEYPATATNYNHNHIKVMGKDTRLCCKASALARAASKLREVRVSSI